MENDDATDAARYRWLRDRAPEQLACIAWKSKVACRLDQPGGKSTPEYVDQVIDVARDDKEIN